MKFGTCRKCGQKIQLNSSELICYHKYPNDKFNTCCGSQNEPELIFEEKEEN